MHIEDAFVAYLKARPGVSDLVSGRIYPDDRPQSDKSLPQIMYQLVSNDFQHTLTGKLTQERPIYQFSIYATSRAGADAVADQVKAALSDYQGIMGGLEIEKIELQNEFFSKYQTDAISLNVLDLEFEITYKKE